MKLIERAALAVLHKCDPEKAHCLAIKALKTPFVPLTGDITSDRLRTSIAGIDLPNPVGLAAGFDKNAEVIAPLSRAGFGFIEVGAATPRPQEGNPKPRLFRLTNDRAAINRFGFNNRGMDDIASRLAERPKGAVVGLNLGANKDSRDRSKDYALVLNRCARFVDFVTVNISSPNTERLRDLQGPVALNALLNVVMGARAKLPAHLPVFLKIAPDLESADIRDISYVAQANGVDAIIATNTTLSRDGITDMQARETGGLSGAPLFEKSTRILAQIHKETDGAIPLIGVGGISSADDAYAKIRAGASAVQLYTALIYSGLSLAADIAYGLDKLLERDGFANVTEAVGTERDRWLS